MPPGLEVSLSRGGAALTPLPSSSGVGVLNLNFDATSDLQDLIFEAEEDGGPLPSAAVLLGHLKHAVTLLQQRESELLRIAAQGNELASALSVAQAAVNPGGARHASSPLSSPSSSQPLGSPLSPALRGSRLHRHTSAATTASLLASKEEVINALKEELAVQQQLPQSLAAECAALRNDMNEALDGVDLALSGVPEGARARSIPGQHPVVAGVTALAASLLESRAALASAAANQRMQEDAHRRLISSYEAGLRDAEPLLRKGSYRTVRAPVGCAHAVVQTETLFDLQEKDVELRVARQRLQEMEEQVANAQEQSLDERAQLQEARGQAEAAVEAAAFASDRLRAVCLSEAHLRRCVAEAAMSRCSLGQSEALGDLTTSMLEWQQTDAVRQAWGVRAVRPTVADIKDLVRMWCQDQPGSPESSASSSPVAGQREVAMLQRETAQLRDELARLQRTLGTTLEEKGSVEAELVELRCHADRARQIACAATQTEGGIVRLVPHKRTRSCPSRRSESSISSKTEPREEPSAYSSMFSSTSSRWSFKKGTAPAAALDLMVPAAGGLGTMLPALCASPPMLTLHVSQPGTATVPSSPEPGLRFPPNMIVAKPRPGSLSGALRGRTRRPMKALELPPSPDKQRFVRKVCPRTLGVCTREDELVDQLSIPQTESVVDVQTLPGMSPSEASEPFSPPMSPTRMRYGRQVALSTTPGSCAIPLSPVMGRLSKGGSAVSAVSLQGICVAVQTEGGGGGGDTPEDFMQFLPSPRGEFVLASPPRLGRGGVCLPGGGMSPPAGAALHRGSPHSSVSPGLEITKKLPLVLPELPAAASAVAQHPPLSPTRPREVVAEAVQERVAVEEKKVDEEEESPEEPVDAGRKDSEDDLQYSCDDSIDNDELCRP